ncbi:MAG: hypothetical protein J0L73_10080 [Verrucomicrobia bacterium]|nr:hypothetical protein [Verrucomicrobiota bacterium]
MKSLSLLPLCLLLSLPYIPSVAALPPDVEQLIQADKYAEALTKVNALLQQTPNDQELLSARKDLQALVPGANTSSVTASPPIPQTKELSPLDAKELELIMADLNKAVGDARQPVLKELSSRTSALIGTYPDAINLWAMRALAVLELEQATAAKEAGANLLRLGADRSTNDQMLSLLAMLKRKGWLMTQEEYEKDKVAVVQQAKEQKEKEAADAAAKKKARAAKISELRQQYKHSMQQKELWDDEGNRLELLRVYNKPGSNQAAENSAYDKMREWSLKAIKAQQELRKLGVEP